MHLQPGLLYPPVWHEALAASLPFMLERDVFVPLLSGGWIEVWGEAVTACGILPISSLSVKEDVMQDFWNPLPVCCFAWSACPQSNCLAVTSLNTTRKPQENERIADMLLRHRELPLREVSSRNQVSAKRPPETCYCVVETPEL